MKCQFRHKLGMWLAELISSYLVIGGNCGCCGKWIEHTIVPYYWRVDICDKCKEDQ